MGDSPHQNLTRRSHNDENLIDKDIEQVLNKMHQRNMVYLREIDILFDCVQCVVQSYLARPYLKELAYSMLMERMKRAGFEIKNEKGGSNSDQHLNSCTPKSDKDGVKDEWNQDLKESISKVIDLQVINI